MALLLLRAMNCVSSFRRDSGTPLVSSRPSRTRQIRDHDDSAGLLNDEKTIRVPRRRHNRHGAVKVRVAQGIACQITVCRDDRRHFKRRRGHTIGQADRLSEDGARSQPNNKQGAQRPEERHC